jgi:hypothetical protein
MRRPSINLGALVSYFVGVVAVAVVGCGGGSGGGLDGGGAGGDGSVAEVDAGGGPGADGGEPGCVFQPTGQFNPTLECAWNAPPEGSPYPTFDDVVMTPVVVNLTDDNADGVVDLADVPDVAFVSYSLQTGSCPAGATCGCCNSSGVLRVVSGGCTGGVLAPHFTVGAAEIEADTGVAGVWLDNSGGLAAGDLDGDGSVDLVATLRNGGTIAFERDGRVKWLQVDHPKGADHLAATQPAIADLDADGAPEVIQGRVVLRGADGSLAWQGTAGVGTNGFMGPVTVAGDVDLDGSLEVLAGGTLYRADGTPAWSFDYPIAITSNNCQASGFPCDGFTATGNFDGDPQGEIVVARAGTIYLLEHDGTPLLLGGAPVQITIPVDDCGKNEGGPPTVADFDGDGEAEIGVAGADYYIVADLECLAAPTPAQCSDPGIRWRVANFDCSSRVTGSSVFDFEGDGRAEVVYADEESFRILDGIDGSVKLSIPNHSHTRLEMPIVVDVDNDGNAEIVFIENASGGATQGVRIYGDATDSWVPTRRIWNQHSYHVTNVTELGAIPAGEPANWLEATDATLSGVMNNFRQNLPEANTFAAPDLTLELTVDAAACALSATVCNAGDIVVGAGVRVRFYDDTTSAEIPCAGGPVATTQPLAPGACETLACEWPSPAPSGAVDVRACVDNEGIDCAPGASGANNECVEDNNLAEASGANGCAQIP